MAAEGEVKMDDGPVGGAAPNVVVGASAAGGGEPAQTDVVKKGTKGKAAAATPEDGAEAAGGKPVAKDKKKGKGAAKGAAKGDATGGKR